MAMRGYQKKVIYIKNTGSEYFEEAYFVVKGENKKEMPRGRMIDEAHRIIEENLERKKKRLPSLYLGYIGMFILGIGIATLIFLIAV